MKSGSVTGEGRGGLRIPFHALAFSISKALENRNPQTRERDVKNGIALEDYT
jgi:hypothetical protein